MRLETERLLLSPLSEEEMEALIAEEADPELRQAYGEMLQGCRREPDKRLWYAVWAIRLKSRPGTVIGDFCFKGLNPDGMVEIGYGLRQGFCGKGYMTETVRAVTAWALSQPGVTRVEAETDPGNLTSQKVLAAAGFVPTGVRGEEGPRFVFQKEVLA
ncbi:MAG: GNAT family N-acetyltransferase [Oscillospiraceae bacterium]|nr:GNAT family N-acetyltransferase [Oscillospiraceae bacterium]